MDNKELNNLLQQLRDEINTTQTVDDKGSELLRDIDQDIHTLLQRTEENPAPLLPAYVQHLDDAVTYFEVTHPSLTMVISKLLDYLSNSGI
jgi:hypothetical protein